MRILYQGLLESPASWARVGRGLVRAWLDAGHDVTALRTRGFKFTAGFPVDDRLQWCTLEEARATTERESAVGLGFLQPPQVDRLLGAPRANLFVWEADRVPAPWITALRVLDQVVVPSRFTADALVTSGLDAARVHVEPYGIDRDAAERAASARPIAPSAPFTFLCVAAPHWRKGLRELFVAYARAFRSSDLVRLRIKTTYDPGRSKRRLAFEIPSWRQLVRECGLDEREAPAIDIEIASPHDATMLLEYAASDVYVGPSWGESFGLAHLEAAAIGLPVIATKCGATPELLGASEDLVRVHQREAGPSIYHPTPGAQVAVADIDSLARRLRWHFDHPEESRAIGRHRAPGFRTMTWAKCAAGILAALPA
ncbi:MAG: glycosyltransferase family 4 protein [Planctomycetes bacterium]|nr:glycosyltransferase family 4 protein [Planctomycetota bacterium]